MNKTLKNVIMGFTLICVIALVVFCVELFLLNRDNDGRPDPVISNVEPEEPADNEELPNEYDPREDDPVDAYPDPNGYINENVPHVAISENAQREAFLLSSIAELVLYVDMEYFEREDLAYGTMFNFLPDGDASIEISISFISPQGGVYALADNFLYNYLSGAETIVEGEQSIANSQVRGLFVTGQTAGRTYSAWLRDIADLDADNFALVIVVNYSTTDQRNMIYSVLDTLSINMLVTAPADDDNIDDVDDADDVYD